MITVIDHDLTQTILEKYSKKESIKNISIYCRSIGRPLGHDKITKLLREIGVLRTSASSRRGKTRAKPVGIKQCNICNDFFERNSGSQKFCKACIPNDNARNVFRSWGLTWSQFQSKLDEQNGVCAGCSSEMIQGNKKSSRTLCVDHDHKTGIIRGLLCHSCNTILGHARDNPAVLIALSIYIEKTKT